MQKKVDLTKTQQYACKSLLNLVYCFYNILNAGNLLGPPAAEWGERPRESVTVIPFKRVSQIRRKLPECTCRYRDAVFCNG